MSKLAQAKNCIVVLILHIPAYEQITLIHDCSVCVCVCVCMLDTCVVQLTTVA